MIVTVLFNVYIIINTHAWIIYISYVRFGMQYMFNINDIYFVWKIFLHKVQIGMRKYW